jgi:hypothetical protein
MVMVSSPCFGPARAGVVVPASAAGLCVLTTLNAPGRADLEKIFRFHGEDLKIAANRADHRSARPKTAYFETI